MAQDSQRSIDPRLLVPVVGVIVVLLIALTVFLLSGGGGDEPETVLATGGDATAAASGDGAAVAATEAAPSVEDAGRLALSEIVDERSVAFAPTQGERRNNAQTQIVQAGVPAASEAIRVFAWQDEDGHVLAAVAANATVAEDLCGISISYLQGTAHLDGSVDVRSRPDCDAPGFFESPVQSLHEPGASSDGGLLHLVRSTASLPDGAEVHVWAFVAVGDEWDNVGFTCDQECTQGLTAYGDPVTAQDFEDEAEHRERERRAYALIRQWMDEVVRVQGEQGFEITEDGWAVALEMQGVLIPLAPPVAR